MESISKKFIRLNNFAKRNFRGAEFNRARNGFTMIELIISIFILSVAIVGIFGAFSMTVILTSDAADRLTATYLAQEGMEIARNIRDTNWLTDGATWLDGLYTTGIPSIDCTQGCEADYMATAMYRWSNTGNYLKINAYGFYVYDPINPLATKYKRKIIITPIPDTDPVLGEYYAMKVSVQVSWDEKANVLYSSRLAGDCDSSNNYCATNSITAVGTLYDWYNY